MTYRELLLWLQNKATQNQLDDTVTILFNHEFYGIQALYVQQGNDVLHNQHPYLLVGESE